MDNREPAPIAEDEVTRPSAAGPLVKLSLFWRTFFLLALLIFFSSVAWLQMFKTQEYEPRILRNAHQIATVVNLTKTALKNSDEIARLSLITMPAWTSDWSMK
jgi:two-component system osmolarity sensor histidine kinase EnvZ